MNEPSESPEKLRDRSATEAFQQLVSDLSEALLSEASRSAAGDKITGEDLYQAYSRLSYPSKDSIQFADAQAVISQALRENRIIEWVCYGMAITLFVFGLILLSFGIVNEDVARRVGVFAWWLDPRVADTRAISVCDQLASPQRCPADAWTDHQSRG